MKLNRIGALGALVVAVAAVGCSSSDKPGQSAGDGTGSLAFKLTTSDGLVDFTSVHYDLTTQAVPPVAVISDDIPVPRPESTISLGIQSLAFGSYALTFEADGTFHNPTTMLDQPVHCTSAPSLFPINSTTTVTLPTITLTCAVTSGQTDGTGSVNANVDVQVVQTTTNNIVETFSYGPRTVLGFGAACEFPPIALKVRNSDPTIVYSWDDNSDGTFSGTAIDGEYHCVTGGTKVLTITATQGTTVSTKQVSVVCDPSPCSISCGNGTREGSEQCDDGPTGSVRCSTSCQITPSCGDGTVDGPSGVCAGGVADADCTEECDTLTAPAGTCDSLCQLIPAVTCGNSMPDPGEFCDPPNGTTCDAACQRIPTCGDTFIDTGAGEVCDNGVNNSNTVPGACRTNCQLAFCGDGVTDPTEQCDPPAAGTCSATCQTVVTPPASLWDTCETCVSGDPDNNDIQQAFCTTAGCQEMEECIINSGCYFPNPYECYCGEGADLDTCLMPSATVPLGACAGLIRAATGNLMTGTNVDNSATLEASTNPGNASGDAQLVISELVQPGNVCNSACFAP